MDKFNVKIIKREKALLEINKVFQGQKQLTVTEKKSGSMHGVSDVHIARKGNGTE